ncbi:MAG TPA: TMEM175 family protein [Burkholderiaceae bacterium]|nr:TMEM175 family protein [Burkholderiaceae bacterium]
MNSNRLEAFSDGVLAIVITVMVLEMKVPDGARIESLASTLPVFLSYVLSYLYVGIYWNNHHHMLHTVERVNGPILWANLHLLFWLSLFPFATAWMGQNHFAVLPTSLYGGVLLMAAIAYWVLQAAIIRAQGSDSLLKKAIGRDWKGRSSPAVYVTGIIVANWSPVVAQALYVAVAFLWLVPDRRIERVVGN